MVIRFTFSVASGYGNNTTWDGYSQYINADGLHVSPVVMIPSLLKLLKPFFFNNYLCFLILVGFRLYTMITHPLCSILAMASIPKWRMDNIPQLLHHYLL